MPAAGPLGSLTSTTIDCVATKARRVGNWTPTGEAERDRLRRDYLELNGEQRIKQVSKLSRFMSRMVDAGQRARRA